MIPDDETTMPENEPLTEEMKARVLSIFKPPFSFSHGYINDATGRMVADHHTDDEPGALIRMRGWGRLTGKGGGMGLSSDEAYEIQCAAGQMFAEAFNAYWGTPLEAPTPPSVSVPVERLEALRAEVVRRREVWQDAVEADYVNRVAHIAACNDFTYLIDAILQAATR